MSEPSSATTTIGTTTVPWEQQRQRPVVSPVIAATSIGTSSLFERTQQPAVVPAMQQQQQQPPQSPQQHQQGAAAVTTTTNTHPKSSHTSPAVVGVVVTYEYNPRWKGYTYILLSSLINFAAVSSVPVAGISVQGRRGVALSFSVVTFVYSLVVLLTDRLQIGMEKINYMKLWDGALEGSCLGIGTLYAIVAVAYMTQVKGIAYLTLNIYFSAWFILVSFVYTLNKWSTAKDLLSIRELTGISATLKSWYIVFVSSMIVTGTCINMLIVLANYQSTTLHENENARSATLGIVFGFCSTMIAVWFILSHYNLIECTKEGGWFELLFIVVVILIWIIAIAVLTDNNSVAATISGSGCAYTLPKHFPYDSILEKITEEIRRADADNVSPECVLTIQNVTYTCDTLDAVVGTEMMTKNDFDTIPGSNLYIFLWICLLASFHLLSRWKTQQALRFAHAQEEQAKKAQIEKKKSSVSKQKDSTDEENNDDSNNESDDDLDEYEDDTDQF